MRSTATGGQPAVVLFDGSQAFWVHGKLHREDGPAIVGPDGYTEGWINGVQQFDRQDGLPAST